MNRGMNAKTDQTCPKGCSHPIEWHTATTVSFNADLKPGCNDYDAISCIHDTCRCKVPADQWEDLLKR
jgi:hypothetical protein